jgi:hypothetical protein
MDIHAGLALVVAKLFPGATIVSARTLSAGGDVSAGGATKAAGYGRPVRVRIRTRDGEVHDLVWHTAAADVFGHDRRADRADEMLLAYDTFGKIPRHVRALDVGAIGRDGDLVSLGGAGEFYLLTQWAEGRPYAEDLRRVAAAGEAGPDDVARCEALAGYLAALHEHAIDAPARYRRSVRDLIGHGEGIFGMIDGYPDDTPAAPPARLHAIERRLLDWRWRLRGRERRLARIHGDFHPFNVIFEPGGDFHLLDASRGCAGDPADDVTAMAVNYVFFASAGAAAWAGLGVLWRRFFAVYLGRRGDGDLLDVAPPYLAWRALVVAHPRFYPDLPAAARDRLLSWIEHTLDAGRLDLASADGVFA